MKYVLGGGIAGLVYAYTHPEYLVIAESAGGSMASVLPIGPRYIHATANSLQFIQDLGLHVGKRVTVRSTTIGDWNSDMEQLYHFKTRGVSAMSYDKTRVKEHDVYEHPTVADVSKRLVEVLGDRIIVDRVAKIFGETGEIFTNSHGMITHHGLVNTIPLPHFVKLFDSTHDVAWGGHYVSIPVRFVHHEIYDSSWPWPGYDYVYFSNYNMPYSRVSKLEVQGREWACFEYPGLDSVKPRPVGSFFDSYLEHQIEMGRVMSSVLFPIGRVISRPVPVETRMQLAKQGISLFGRFAEWDDGLLTHDLIERARWMK